jgi:menaquinone-specific isochorismate synthase
MRGDSRSGEPAVPAELVSALPDPNGYAWIRKRESFVAWGVADRVEVGRGPERFERAAEALRGLFARADPKNGRPPIAVGSFTFDEDEDGSRLIVPARVVRLPEKRDEGGAKVAAVPRIRYAGSTISELDWLEAVDSATSRIRRGALRKVVLARDVHVWAEENLDGRALAWRLARRFPECFTFLCEGLVGATPELLVRRRGRRVESLVLAGSIGRGTDAQEDEAMASALLSSEKDVSEHRLAVESVGDVLSGCCSDLTVDQSPSLLRLANVQHLATSVSGTLDLDLDALRLAGMLHPTAAVCGVPRPGALDVIRELEGMSRARYGGPVGWVDGAGDGEFGIALRCAELAGDRARLFAGAGIVSGSVPEAELEETRLKLRAMQSALEGPALSS